MIDTVRLTASVKSGVLNSFRWWDNESININAEGIVKRKYITIGGGRDAVLPRITAYPDDNLLSFEVSLPKMLHGVNYKLLDDSEIQKSAAWSVQYVAERLRSSLPDWQDWQVSRYDAVINWQVGDLTSSYIMAAGSSPIQHYTRSAYIDGVNRAQGHTWHARQRKVNLYDKGLESGCPGAAGLLRLECQNLNKAAVNVLAKRCKVKPWAGSMLNTWVAKDDLSRWLARAGIKGVLKPSTGLLYDLCKRYDYDDACARYAFVVGYRDIGARMQDVCSPATYKRRLAEARREGWLIDAGERELPELKIP